MGRSVTVKVPAHWKDGAPVQVSTKTGEVVEVVPPKGSAGTEVKMMEHMNKPWKVVQLAGHGMSKRISMDGKKQRQVEVAIPREHKRNESIKVHLPNVIPSGTVEVFPPGNSGGRTVHIREDPNKPWRFVPDNPTRTKEEIIVELATTTFTAHPTWPPACSVSGFGAELQWDLPSMSISGGGDFARGSAAMTPVWEGFTFTKCENVSMEASGTDEVVVTQLCANFIADEAGEPIPGTAANDFTIKHTLTYLEDQSDYVNLIEVPRIVKWVLEFDAAPIAYARESADIFHQGAARGHGLFVTVTAKDADAAVEVVIALRKSIAKQTPQDGAVSTVMFPPVPAEPAVVRWYETYSSKEAYAANVDTGMLGWEDISSLIIDDGIAVTECDGIEYALH